MGGNETMCVGESLGGAILEKFDDYLGPAGDNSRSLTDTQLRETWETRVSLPDAQLFDATGRNLSLIGVDAQFAVGECAITREWALRMMFHPDEIDGILFPSRHDLQRRNIALFGRPRLAAAPRHDPDLVVENIATWKAKAVDAGQLIFGPEQILGNHPELNMTLAELQIVILP